MQPLNTRLFFFCVIQLHSLFSFTCPHLISSHRTFFLGVTHTHREPLIMHSLSFLCTQMGHSVCRSIIFQQTFSFFIVILSICPQETTPTLYLSFIKSQAIEAAC